MPLALRLMRARLGGSSSGSQPSGQAGHAYGAYAAYGALSTAAAAYFAAANSAIASWLAGAVGVAWRGGLQPCLASPAWCAAKA